MSEGRYDQVDTKPLMFSAMELSPIAADRDVSEMTLADINALLNAPKQNAELATRNVAP